MPLKSISSISKRIFSGGTPSTNEDLFWGGSFAWLSSGETFNRFIYSTEKTITQDGIDNSSTKIAKSGTIVIASAGQGHTRGQTSMLKIDTYINQSIIAIEVDPSVVNPFYIFYNLSCRYDELRSISDGASSRGSLTTKLIGDLKLDLPDLNTQNKIACIINSIDEKVENGIRINDNLFKILESEYNNIANEYPKEIELSSLCHIIKDKRSSNGLTVNNYYSTENILPNKAGVVPATSLPLVEKVTHCIEGDVLISNIRPYFKKIHYCDCISGCSADVLCFRSKEEDYSPYLYSILRSDDFFDYVVAGSKGTKMPRGDKEHIIQYMIPNPPKDVIDSFNTIAKGILSVISNNCKINLQLVCMRDYLMPKLMSGEIDVSTIELPTKYSFNPTDQ